MHFKQKTAAMESVLALAAVIGPDVDKQITRLQSKGLLSQNKVCPAYNSQMDLQQTDVIDKYQ